LSTAITNHDVNPSIGNLHVLIKVVARNNELANVSTPKKTFHPSNHKINYQWFKLRAAIRKELNLKCQNGEENIVATKKDGSYSEGEMEHIDDELDENHENLTDDDLKNILPKNPRMLLPKQPRKARV